MGLMDKVKAQATQIAQKGQDAAREGKSRLDQAQANKQADAMLRNLGALTYAERTNRVVPDSEDKVNKLVGQLSDHESVHGINLAPYAGSTVPPQGPPSEPTGTSDPTGASGPTSTPEANTSDPTSTSYPPEG
jgi:hypothetical protein